MPNKPKNITRPVGAEPLSAAGSEPAPGGSSTSSASGDSAAELTVTISGTEHAVRRAVTALGFSGGWDPTIARQAAIDETLVSGVTVNDTLGGAKVAMASQDARDLYVQRCVRDAKHRGHPIQDPSKIPADSGTKVGEVGDALFDNSLH